MKKVFRLLAILVSICSLLAVHLVSAQGPEEKLPVSLGVWGGEHLRLTVLNSGATLEYDCAFGNIGEPLLHNEMGRFEAQGTHYFETGGPSQPSDAKPKQHPALYLGSVKGDEMTLKVTLPETNRNIGDFTLHLGSTALLEKCL